MLFCYLITNKTSISKQKTTTTTTTLLTKCTHLFDHRSLFCWLLRDKWSRNFIFRKTALTGRKQQKIFAKDYMYNYVLELFTYVPIVLSGKGSLDKEPKCTVHEGITVPPLSPAFGQISNFLWISLGGMGRSL